MKRQHENVGRAVDEDQLSPAQANYLLVLIDLIERYEDDHVPHGPALHSAGEVLRYLTAQAGMTGSDLRRLLGNRQLGPALIRGDREPSKAHIAKLCELFKVSADLFFFPTPADAGLRSPPA